MEPNAWTQVSNVLRQEVLTQAHREWLRLEGKSATGEAAAASVFTSAADDITEAAAPAVAAAAPPSSSSSAGDAATVLRPEKRHPLVSDEATTELADAFADVRLAAAAFAAEVPARAVAFVAGSQTLQARADVAAAVLPFTPALVPATAALQSDAEAAEEDRLASGQEAALLSDTTRDARRQDLEDFAAYAVAAEAARGEGIVHAVHGVRTYAELVTAPLVEAAAPAPPDAANYAALVQHRICDLLRAASVAIGEGATVDEGAAEGGRTHRRLLRLPGGSLLCPRSAMVYRAWQDEAAAAAFFARYRHARAAAILSRTTVAIAVPPCALVRVAGGVLASVVMLPPLQGEAEASAYAFAASERKRNEGRREGEQRESGPIFSFDHNWRQWALRDDSQEKADQNEPGFWRRGATAFAAQYAALDDRTAIDINPDKVAAVTQLVAARALPGLDARWYLVHPPALSRSETLESASKSTALMVASSSASGVALLDATAAPREEQWRSVLLHLTRDVMCRAVGRDQGDMQGAVDAWVGRRRTLDALQSGVAAATTALCSAAVAPLHEYFCQWASGVESSKDAVTASADDALHRPATPTPDAHALVTHAGASSRLQPVNAASASHSLASDRLVADVAAALGAPYLFTALDAPRSEGDATLMVRHAGWAGTWLRDVAAVRGLSAATVAASWDADLALAVAVSENGATTLPPALQLVSRADAAGCFVALPYIAAAELLDASGASPEAASTALRRLPLPAWAADAQDKATAPAVTPAAQPATALSRRQTAIAQAQVQARALLAAEAAATVRRQRQHCVLERFLRRAAVVVGARGFDDCNVDALRSYCAATPEREAALEAAGDAPDAPDVTLTRAVAALRAHSALTEDGCARPGAVRDARAVAVLGARLVSRVVLADAASHEAANARSLSVATVVAEYIHARTTAPRAAAADVALRIVAEDTAEAGALLEATQYLPARDGCWHMPLVSPATESIVDMAYFGGGSDAETLTAWRTLREDITHIAANSLQAWFTPATELRCLSQAYTASPHRISTQHVLPAVPGHVAAAVSPTLLVQPLRAPLLAWIRSVCLRHVAAAPTPATRAVLREAMGVLVRALLPPVDAPNGRVSRAASTLPTPTQRQLHHTEVTLPLMEAVVRAVLTGVLAAPCADHADAAAFLTRMLGDHYVPHLRALVANPKAVSGLGVLAEGQMPRGVFTCAAVAALLLLSPQLAGIVPFTRALGADATATTTADAVQWLIEADPIAAPPQDLLALLAASQSPQGAQALRAQYTNAAALWQDLAAPAPISEQTSQLPGDDETATATNATDGVVAWTHRVAPRRPDATRLLLRDVIAAVSGVIYTSRAAHDAARRAVAATWRQLVERANPPSAPHETRERGRFAAPLPLRLPQQVLVPALLRTSNSPTGDDAAADAAASTPTMQLRRVQRSDTDDAAAAQGIDARRVIDLLDLVQTAAAAAASQAVVALAPALQLQRVGRAYLARRDRRGELKASRRRKFYILPTEAELAAKAAQAAAAVATLPPAPTTAVAELSVEKSNAEIASLDDTNEATSQRVETADAQRNATSTAGAAAGSSEGGIRSAALARVRVAAGASVEETADGAARAVRLAWPALTEIFGAHRDAVGVPYGVVADADPLRAAAPLPATPGCALRLVLDAPFVPLDRSAADADDDFEALMDHEGTTRPPRESVTDALRAVWTVRAAHPPQPRWYGLHALYGAFAADVAEVRAAARQAVVEALQAASLPQQPTDASGCVAVSALDSFTSTTATTAVWCRHALPLGPITAAERFIIASAARCGAGTTAAAAPAPDTAVDQQAAAIAAAPAAEVAALAAPEGETAPSDASLALPVDVPAASTAGEANTDDTAVARHPDGAGTDEGVAAAAPNVQGDAARDSDGAAEKAVAPTNPGNADAATLPPPPTTHANAATSISVSEVTMAAVEAQQVAAPLQQRLLLRWALWEEARTIAAAATAAAVAGASGEGGRALTVASHADDVDVGGALRPPGTATAAAETLLDPTLGTAPTRERLAAAPLRAVVAAACDGAVDAGWGGGGGPAAPGRAGSALGGIGFSTQFPTCGGGVTFAETAFGLSAARLLGARETTSSQRARRSAAAAFDLAAAELAARAALERDARAAAQAVRAACAVAAANIIRRADSLAAQASARLAALPRALRAADAAARVQRAWRCYTARRARRLLQLRRDLVRSLARAGGLPHPGLS